MNKMWVSEHCRTCLEKIGGYCYGCTSCEIDQIKADLEEAKVSLEKQIDSKDKCCKVLQEQLSNAKNEIKTLRQSIKFWQESDAEAKAKLQTLERDTNNVIAKEALDWMIQNYCVNERMENKFRAKFKMEE